eukprot:1161273-Pelagomonas_calceolata.AAC.4
MHLSRCSVSSTLLRAGKCARPTLLMRTQPGSLREVSRGRREATARVWFARREQWARSRPARVWGSNGIVIGVLRLMSQALSFLLPCTAPLDPLYSLPSFKRPQEP